MLFNGKAICGLIPCVVVIPCHCSWQGHLCGFTPFAVVITHNWLMVSFGKVENLRELNLVSKLQQQLGKQWEQKQRNVP